MGARRGDRQGAHGQGLREPRLGGHLLEDGRGGREGHQAGQLLRALRRRRPWRSAEQPVQRFHPDDLAQVFGGVFAQRGVALHREHLRLVGSDYIDVLVYDFYPADHVAEGVDDEIEAVFQGTDIGGPAVIEAGIKAGCWVALPDEFSHLLWCVTNPDPYDRVRANRELRFQAKGAIKAYQIRREEELIEAMPEEFSFGD